VKAVRVAALVTLLLLAAESARAELNQKGDLIVSFDGRIVPKRLPRETPGPVSVRVAGNVRPTDGAPLPQLETISVAINRSGRLDDAGLPICMLREIQPATESEARRICGDALVGDGHVVLQVHFPSQPSFTVKANLLAFNGPRRRGRKLILAQAYAQDPPGAFVLPFVLRRKSGVFGTKISTTLPNPTRNWAYLTHFDMTLDRQYRYRGRSHSYVSAACSAPVGAHGAIFPFAKATYGFDDGKRLTTTVTRTCVVR
jgi:hypothetical protein